MRDSEAAVLAVEKAQKDVTNIGLGAKISGIMDAGGIVAQSVSTVTDFASALGILTSRLEVLVGIGDEIAAVRCVSYLSHASLKHAYADPSLCEYCLESFNLCVSGAAYV